MTRATDRAVRTRGSRETFWRLQVGRDWRNMSAAPLEMFYWSRIVIDEYTYNKEREVCAPTWYHTAR